MKLHIYGALQSYKKRAPVRMHMPGHKGSRAFALFGSAAAYDITELPFSDCLESPSGIIARAQTDIADILGARRSHIRTDGSSCGIYAMLWAVRGRGAKLIASRDSHKSVFSACAVLGIGSGAGSFVLAGSGVLGLGLSGLRIGLVVVLALARGCAVLLPALEKAELFRYIDRHGPYPKKSFSIGEAREKRYYLECRRIK